MINLSHFYLVQKFTVEGVLVLPRYGYFKEISGKSCIHFVVRDAVQCGIPCNVPVRGSALMKNININKKNEVRFSVSGEGGLGIYYLS